jgi:hypothetical protein
MIASLKISTQTYFSLRNPVPKCVEWSIDISYYYASQKTI